MACTAKVWGPESWCIATAVLSVVAGFFILLSAAAIACSGALCCKVYHFKRIRCSYKVIHCLCCSCEVKDLQTEEDHGKNLAHSSS